MDMKTCVHWEEGDDSNDIHYGCSCKDAQHYWNFDGAKGNKGIAPLSRCTGNRNIAQDCPCFSTVSKILPLDIILGLGL